MASLTANETYINHNYNHFYNMAFPIDSVASTVAAPGGFSTFPSFAGLGYHPTAYRDLFPSLRARFDTLGYAPFVPEGAFKVEEARFNALKEWSSLNQKREEARLKSEAELEDHIISRAKAEVELVKCQIEKVKNEKIKLDLEIQILLAEKAKLDAAQAPAPAAPAPSAAAAKLPPPPPQAEVKQLLSKLEKMDPCSSGYPWIDKPEEGGFRCEGGSHFKTYAEAKAFVAQRK